MTEDLSAAIRSLVSERDELKQHCIRLQGLLDRVGFPPGHHYSPLVDSEDRYAARAVRERLAAPAPAGVRLDPDAMRAMLHRLASHHRLFPFPRDRGTHRYYSANPFFGCHDAAVYFSLLLEFKPRRVIEIGTGFSSKLLLDTNEEFFGGGMEVTLIDPSPEALAAADSAIGTRLMNRPVQDVPLSLFDQLETNDILFVDSSHVCKTGSDVNFCLFEILPRLRPGVLIHVHDIFYPFEYLADWVLEERRSWNETYLIHAFLQFNSAFEIVYWNNFVFHFLSAELRDLMPICMENEGGSLWMRRCPAL